MAPDTAAFLAGSDDRVTLLTYLTDQSAAPATIADDLPLARRSIQRHLVQFVERGWAAKDAGRYRLTTAGELIAEAHTAYLDTLDLLDEFDPFYRHLPNRESAPEPKWLQDANLTVATEADPQAPVHHYLSSVQSLDGDRIRMFSPVLSRLFHDVHAELAFKGVHTDLIMSDDLVDRARELNPAEFDVVASVDVLDVYRYPDPVTFGMTLGKNRVLLGAYDDGQLKACVDASNPELVAWAGDLFDQYREQAKRIEPPLSLPFSLGNR